MKTIKLSALSPFLLLGLLALPPQAWSVPPHPLSAANVTGTGEIDVAFDQAIDPTTGTKETTKPPFNRKQFGGSIGGPINKGDHPSFFFFAWEKYHEDQ